MEANFVNDINIKNFHITSSCYLESENQCLLGTSSGALLKVFCPSVNIHQTIQISTALIIEIIKIKDDELPRNLAVCLDNNNSVFLVDYARGLCLTSITSKNARLFAICKGKSSREFLLSCSGGLVKKLLITRDSHSNSEDFFAFDDSLFHNLLSNTCFTAISQHDNNVFLGSSDGDVYMLDYETKNLQPKIKLKSIQSNTLVTKSKKRRLKLEEMRNNIPKYENVFLYLEKIDKKLSELDESTKQIKQFESSFITDCIYNRQHGVWIISNSNGYITTIDQNTFTIVSEYKLHDGPITKILQHGDQTIISAGYDGKVYWSTLTNGSLYPKGFKQISKYNLNYIMRFETTLVICGMFRTYFLCDINYDLTNNKVPVRKTLSIPDTIQGLQLSQSDYLVSVLDQNNISIFNVLPSKMPHSIHTKIIDKISDSLSPVALKYLNLSDLNSDFFNVPKIPFVNKDEAYHLVKLSPNNCLICDYSMMDDFSDSNKKKLLIRGSDSKLFEFTFTCQLETSVPELTLSNDDKIITILHNLSVDLSNNSITSLNYDTASRILAVTLVSGDYKKELDSTVVLIKLGTDENTRLMSKKEVQISNEQIIPTIKISSENFNLKTHIQEDCVACAYSFKGLLVTNPDPAEIHDFTFRLNSNHLIWFNNFSFVNLSEKTNIEFQFINTLKYIYTIRNISQLKVYDKNKKQFCSIKAYKEFKSLISSTNYNVWDVFSVTKGPNNSVFLSTSYIVLHLQQQSVVQLLGSIKKPLESKINKLFYADNKLHAILDPFVRSDEVVYKRRKFGQIG